MKTNKVPFCANTSDNLHCYQAVIKMILDYFLPNKKYSWKEIEKITGLRKGFWTWPLKAAIELKKIGFSVVNMEDFDYLKFSQNPEKYLIDKFGEEMGQAQIKNSYLLQEKEFAKKYLKLFRNQIKPPTISDIKNFLRKGYLVICNVNSKALNNQKGYSGHFVLIYSHDKNHFFLHDPGLPPRKCKKVTFKRFLKAWAYPKKEAKNLQAFKYG